MHNGVIIADYYTARFDALRARIGGRKVRYSSITDRGSCCRALTFPTVLRQKGAASASSRFTSAAFGGSI
jgi:hypothetical protein